jgi:hypothetical protein
MVIASTNCSTYTLLDGDKFNEKFRLRLRAEAKTTANKLRNMYVTATDKNSAYHNLHVELAKINSY